MFMNTNHFFSVSFLFSCLVIPYAYCAEKDRQALVNKLNPLGLFLWYMDPDTIDQSRLHGTVKHLVKLDHTMINAQKFDDTHYTPLHTALVKGYDRSFITLLLELGSSVTLTNNANMTPLEMACALNAQKVKNVCTNIMVLAQHEAENQTITENNKIKKGDNPLHSVMKNKSIKSTKNKRILLRRLEAAGYSLNAQDKKGCTPAHYALANTSNKKSMITKLNNLGADLTIKNNDGKNPHQYAKQQKKLKTTKQ